MAAVTVDHQRRSPWPAASRLQSSSSSSASRPRSRQPSPRPPTPPRPSPRHQARDLDSPPMSAMSHHHQHLQQRVNGRSNSSGSGHQQHGSMLDLSYLAQYEIDGSALAETASLGTGPSIAGNGGTDFDVVDVGGEHFPLQTPLPEPPTAHSVDVAVSLNGGSSPGEPAEKALSTTSGQDATPRRRGTRPMSTRNPAATSANGPERRFRATPHLPSGNAPRVPPTTMYWSRAPVHGLLPQRKFRAHSLTLVDNHEAWVFGGCDNEGCSRDVYVLDTETFAWNAPDLAGDAPPPCRAHSATLVDGKRIFIFGGGAASEYYDSLWILDTYLRRWSQVTVEGPRPSRRRAHTAVLFKGRIIVFGGGDGSKALNDVWALDTNALAWELLETHGKKPAPRGYHTANVVGHNMVVVGGSDGRTCFPDVWVLNLETLTWRFVETERSYRRLSHCATQVGSYLFVFSGHDSQKYNNELLLFNLITLQWESRPVAGRPPSVRAYQAAMLTDSRLFVLGGFDGSNTFDDVHLLDLAASAYLPQVTSFSMN